MKQHRLAGEREGGREGDEPIKPDIGSQGRSQFTICGHWSISPQQEQNIGQGEVVGEGAESCCLPRESSSSGSCAA